MFKWMDKLIDFFKLEDIEDDGDYIWEQELADSRRIHDRIYDKGIFAPFLLLGRKVR